MDDTMLQFKLKWLVNKYLFHIQSQTSQGQLNQACSPNKMAFADQWWIGFTRKSFSWPFKSSAECNSRPFIYLYFGSQSRVLNGPHQNCKANSWALYQPYDWSRVCSSFLRKLGSIGSRSRLLSQQAFVNYVSPLLSFSLLLPISHTVFSSFSSSLILFFSPSAIFFLYSFVITCSYSY